MGSTLLRLWLLFQAPAIPRYGAWFMMIWIMKRRRTSLPCGKDSPAFCCLMTFLWMYPAGNDEQLIIIDWWNPLIFIFAETVFPDVSVVLFRWRIYTERMDKTLCNLIWPRILPFVCPCRILWPLYPCGIAAWWLPWRWFEDDMFDQNVCSDSPQRSSS